MKWNAQVIRFFTWGISTILIALIVLFAATRPRKVIVLSMSEYHHASGRYCALIVKEDRDWRQLSVILSNQRTWSKAWRASLFVGRDCEKRQDEGVWTDVGWDWIEDASNQISSRFTDEGFTSTRRDGRSTFIPRELYLQKAK